MSFKQTPCISAILWVLCGSAASHATTPSFDCRKASSRVEQAICNSDTLAQQDQQIARRYQQILKTSPAIVEPAFFIATQQRWNSSRHSRCEQEKRVDNCLLDLMQERNQQLLGLQNSDATARIHMAIAMIPKQPVQAAQQLRRYPDDAVANAWLVYMGYYSPGSGVGTDERQALQDKVINTLTRQDDFLSEALALDQRKTAQGVFYLLRGAYDGSDDSAAYSEGCPQYFMFARHDKAAFDAFGPQYGSSRDAPAPYCFPNHDFYNLAAWQELKQSLYKPITAAYNHTGTMRYASFSHFAVVSLRMSVFPQQYTAASVQQEKVQAIHTIQNWSYATPWPKKQRDLTMQLIRPAEKATAQWLVKQRGLSPQQASLAASGIVGTYLHMWVDWLAQPE